MHRIFILSQILENDLFRNFPCSVVRNIAARNLNYLFSISDHKIQQKSLLFRLLYGPTLKTTSNLSIWKIRAKCKIVRSWQTFFCEWNTSEFFGKTFENKAIKQAYPFWHSSAPAFFFQTHIRDKTHKKSKNFKFTPTIQQMIKW